MYTLLLPPTGFTHQTVTGAIAHGVNNMLIYFVSIFAVFFKSNDSDLSVLKLSY